MLSTINTCIEDIIYSSFFAFARVQDNTTHTTTTTTPPHHTWRCALIRIHESTHSAFTSFFCSYSWSLACYSSVQLPLHHICSAIFLPSPYVMFRCVDLTFHVPCIMGPLFFSFLVPASSTILCVYFDVLLSISFCLSLSCIHQCTYISFSCTTPTQYYILTDQKKKKKGPRFF